MKYKFTVSIQQKLLDAHRQQRTTEHHLLKLAENEKFTVRQLCKDEEAAILSVAKQTVSIEGDSFTHLRVSSESIVFS